MSRILLCAATGFEAGACRAAIRDAGAEERCEVLRTGMGLRNAGQALEARLSRGPRPEWVISTGFAGCRSAASRVGQWAFARSVRREGGRRLELPEKAPPFFERESGMALETDVVSLGGVEILEQGTSGDAPRPELVEMESFAWAETAMAHGIRFQVLRLISDTPDSPLPAAVGHLVAISTAESWRGRAAAGLRGGRAAVLDPRGIWRFARQTHRLTGLMTEGWTGFLRGTPFNE